MAESLILLKALGDKTRIKIIQFLLSGEKCVCEIFPHVKRTQSTVSIQLSKLEKCGLITSRRQGKRIFYGIKDYRVCDILKILGYKGEFTCKKKNKVC